MVSRSLRLLVVVACAGAVAVATSSAGAATTKHCGSVSYAIPNTGGHGHSALNNLSAVGVSCTTAKEVAHAFLVSHKAPSGWHAKARTVVVKRDGTSNTVGQEIFTRGSERVTGDVAN
jgi:hypothetical protein